MPVETSSMFERVIQDHLALKERNARLDGKMPIEGTRTRIRFENHPLFKSEEQARHEETMDGVDPDFSDETLDDVGVGMWPGSQPEAVAETWSEEPSAVTPQPEPGVEEPPPRSSRRRGVRFLEHRRRPRLRLGRLVLVASPADSLRIKELRRGRARSSAPSR